MIKIINKTIDYYNKNADKFYNSTVNGDMGINYSHFEKYIKKNAYIMDLGCGSGRDSRYFINKGYKVLSIDGSEKMCSKASSYIKQEVMCIKFEDINYINKFDAIWACASLLHVNKKRLGYIFNKLENSLKENGIMYVSFKYGDFEGERRGRYFVYMKGEALEKIIKKTDKLKIIETWITNDIRKDRNGERWFNCIIKKANNF